MKILAITQARVSSTRLPAKVLKPLGSATVLDLHIRRVLKSKYIDKLIVATTIEEQSHEIIRIAQQNNVDVYQGSLNDVLDRFYQAALPHNPQYVIRVTSDCPLLDPVYIDDLITRFLSSGCEYAYNGIKPTLPDGLDIEMFTFDALRKSWQIAQKKSEREHVTLHIRESGLFKVHSVEYNTNWQNLRLTLDTQEDYSLLCHLVDHVGEFSPLKDYIKYIDEHKDLLSLNSHILRNEGLIKSLEQDITNDKLDDYDGKPKKNK